jgi:hypothetical protein
MQFSSSIGAHKLLAASSLRKLLSFPSVDYQWIPSLKLEERIAVRQCVQRWPSGVDPKQVCQRINSVSTTALKLTMACGHTDRAQAPKPEQLNQLDTIGIHII